MPGIIELTDAELDNVAAGQGDSPTFTFGDQKDNVIAVQAAVNVGDINILSNPQVTIPL